MKLPSTTHLKALAKLRNKKGYIIYLVDPDAKQGFEVTYEGLTNDDAFARLREFAADLVTGKLTSEDTSDSIPPPKP